ncbi:MAG TPA: helix-turn-helix transcriptional regulator, partial [Streptosporangiaceae bacterium]|nr:helix-turn-helix transcriptional regulator [Streptosporangiaceae bacterium]
MGRAERPLEPGSGLVAAFAHELRLLRQAAGSPTYRALAQRTHYSVTSLSQAASGRCLPTLGVTRAFVAGCGGDVQEWERRWRQAAAAAVAGDEPGGRMPAPGSTTAGASSGWAVGGASTASAPAVSPAAAAGRLGWSWLAGRGGRLLGVP